MTLQRSFMKYVKTHFENQLFTAAEKFIDENKDDLELFSRQMMRYENAELVDIEVKQTYVENHPGSVIDFDVLLEAEIYIKSYTNHNDFEDSYFRWLRVSCSGEMNAGVKNFKILDIAIYDKKKGYKNEHPLSDQLIPLIRKNDLDKVAETILERYFPLALDVPTALSPDVLASKMGLTIEHSEITEDCSIFGQIYFQDDLSKSIKAGTILVDPRVMEVRNIGAMNNTIIHECVHWALHRKAFELERAFNAELLQLSTSLEPISPQRRSTTDWMEWHAQALTPKIMMPRKMFRQEAQIINKRLIEEGFADNQLDVIEKLIDELASFFGVSRLSAKIRLLEVGYEEAIGAFNFIENQYIPTHRWEKGAISSHQTFCISSQDAAIQSVLDPDFGDVLNSGMYLYVDSHFVLNLPQYLEKDIFGKTTLSLYARNHMDECCLVFDVSIKSKASLSDEHFVLTCVLNRDKDAPIELEIQYHKGYENSTKESQRDFLAKTVKENSQMYASLTNDPCDCLEKVLKWRNMTKLDLSKKILCDEKTIRRIFNGESNGTMATMVAICLVLYLPPEISFHIIEKSSLSFKMNDESHQWYHFVLQTHFGKSLEETRTFLKQYDISL